jgi:hypothetical protein
MIMGHGFWKTVQQGIQKLGLSADPLDKRLGIRPVWFLRILLNTGGLAVLVAIVRGGRKFFLARFATHFYIGHGYRYMMGIV